MRRDPIKSFDTVQRALVARPSKSKEDISAILAESLLTEIVCIHLFMDMGLTLVECLLVTSYF